MSELAPAHNPSIKQLRHRMLRTFYTSFYVVQGNQDAQKGVLALAGSRHHETITAAGYSPDVATETNPPDTDMRHLPVGHVPVGQDEIREQIGKHWQIFADSVRQPAKIYDTADAVVQRTMLTAANSCITSDNSAMRNYASLEPGVHVPYEGRRVATPDGDTHGSFIRQHMFAGETTRDPVIDTIFQDMGRLVAGQIALQPENADKMRIIRGYNLPRLAGAWEYYHPDESFWGVTNADGQALIGHLAVAATRPGFILSPDRISHM